MPFYVGNAGNEPLDFGGFAMTPGFLLDAGSTTCTTAGPLQSGGGCVVGAVFAPTLAGNTAGALTLTDSSDGLPGSTQTVTLSGSGFASQAVFATEPSSLGWGDVLVGLKGSVLTLTVTNTGTAPGTLSPAVAGANAGEFSVAGGTCPLQLAAGAQCTLQIQFAPGALGLRAGILQLSTGGTGIPLSGTGVNALAGGVEYSFAMHDFGAVVEGSTSTPVVLTVVNAGSTAVTVSMPRVSGANAADFPQIASTCSVDHAAAVLSPGASCDITLAFSPISAGPRAGTLLFSDSGGGSATVLLSGTGTPAVVLGSASASQNFGALAIGKAQTHFYVVQFATPVAVGRIAAVLAGAENRDFRVATGDAGACQIRSYAAGEQCTVAVSFSPLAPGTRNGALLLADSNGEPILTAYLEGVGLAPALAVGAGTTETLGTLPPSTGIVPVVSDGNGQIFLGASASAFTVKAGAAVTPVGTAVALAIDGAGNLYLGNSQGQILSRNPLGATVLLATHLGLNGMAVDGQGVVYSTDSLHVYARQPDGTEHVVRTFSYLPGTQLTTGPTGGIAVDAQGALHVRTCYGTSILAPDGSYTPASGAACVTNLQDALLLDASGAEFRAVAGGAVEGIGATPGGDLLLVSQTNGGNALTVLHRAQPQSMQFAATVAGQQSGSSATAVVNYGNVPYAIASLTVAGPFAMDEGANASCSVGLAIAPGGSCGIALHFAPLTAGSITGSLTISSSSAGPAVVPLAGTATAATPHPVTVTWPTPADITPGTPLSETQLNATAPVPGVFRYSPALGTVLPAGVQTLSVQFTPEDTASYAAATAQVSLTVLPAAPAVLQSSASSLAIAAGQGSGSLGLTLTAPAGFAGTVQFACSGLPAGASCLFAPATIVVAPGTTAPVLSQLTISVASAGVSAALGRGPAEQLPAPFSAAVFMLPGGLASAGYCAGKRRRYGRGLFVLVGALALGLGCGLTGCGAASSTAAAAAPATGTQGGSPAPSYTVTVTASGAGTVNFTGTTNVALVVAP